MHCNLKVARRRASRPGLFLAYFVLRMQDAHKLLFPATPIS